MSTAPTAATARYSPIPNGCVSASIVAYSPRAAAEVSCKMRWNIEKSFDEVKNKLGEKKAWANSVTTKGMQAQFICLSENLLLLIEHELGQAGPTP